MSESKKPRTQPKKKQRTWKGEATFVHDLFKASVANAKKNVSWRYGEPNIRDVEHCHWFHTFNSQGRPQKFTNAVGGHFHEITWHEDPKTGDLVAKCGLPMQKVKRKRPNGTFQSVVRQVEWPDLRNSDDGKIKDSHSHEMEYILSEELNADSIRKLRNSSAAEIIQAQQAKQSGKFENEEVKMVPG